MEPILSLGHINRHISHNLGNSSSFPFPSHILDLGNLGTSVSLVLQTRTMCLGEVLPAAPQRRGVGGQVPI
jgi:hypothetical protein